MPGALTTIVGILAQYAMQAVTPTAPAPDAATEPTRSGAGGATDGAGPSTSASAPGTGAGMAGGEGRNVGGSGGGAAGAAGVDRLSRSASLEDCVIKMLRLVANLAIHPEASDAPQISCEVYCEDCCVETIGQHDLAADAALSLSHPLSQPAPCIVVVHLPYPRRWVPCSRSSSKWWTACCTFLAATSTRTLRSWC